MIMNIPKISVIIPVYNTSKYVKKCLNSVCRQNIQNIEVIVVNDASTDNSLSIIKRLAKHDRRLVVISKDENEGLEEARRSGINIARGEYICHVDSDDWLPEDSLEILLDAADKYAADIVVGNFVRVFDRFTLLKKAAPKFCTRLLAVNNDTFINDYFVNFFGVNVFPVSMWGKLYRTSFVKTHAVVKLGFDLGEDLNYNIQIFPKAEKIVFIPELVYCYRYGGMTSKFNSQLLPAAIKMYNLKQDIASKLDSETYKKYIRIELKNYLKTYIEMFLKFRDGLSSVEHKQEIKKILDLPEFIELKEYYLSQKTHGFEQAFSHGDLDEMYSIINEDYRKLEIQYKLKRVLSSMLS